MQSSFQIDSITIKTFWKLIPHFEYQLHVFIVLNVDKKLLIATDVLEYLLERPDPSLQTVEEFLQIYESPYKITPASGKYKQQELNILSITAAD